MTPELDTSPDRAVYPGLTGRIAVVTGGSRGIGAATAAALAANGVSVVVVGRDQAAIDATVDAITVAGGRAIGVVADCTVEADVDGLRQVVTDRLGPVDILAAFAGGNGMPVATAVETVAHWRQVIDSDLSSTFLTGWSSANKYSLMGGLRAAGVGLPTVDDRPPQRGDHHHVVRRGPPTSPVLGRLRGCQGRRRCVHPPPR